MYYIIGRNTKYIIKISSILKTFFTILCNQMQKTGSVEMMRKSIAMSLCINFLINKYTGIPTNPARVNPITCLLVRLNATFVFTCFQSLRVGT